MSKKDKQNGILGNVRKIEEQREQQAARARELARKAEEEKKKAYEEQLRQERLELIRLKQGVIDESETIHEEKEVPKKYTVWQKIGNFIYHNKWWMGMAAFFVFVGGYLTVQTLTTVRPDMIVLLLVHDDYFNAACSDNICTLFEQYIQDENGDGKVDVDVYYIPASEETADRSGYTGDSTKLFTEFQTGEAVLVISDEGADAFIVPDNNLMDLEDGLGQYTQTEAMRFYLSDTGFAEAVGWDEPLDEDVYIGIRKVKKTMDSEKKMQEVFDISYPALEQLAAQFGTPEE